MEIQARFLAIKFNRNGILVASLAVLDVRLNYDEWAVSLPINDSTGGSGNITE